MLLLQHRAVSARPDVRIRVEAELRDQNVSEEARFEATWGTARLFARINGHATGACALNSNGRFAAFVGTPVWRGLGGRELLEFILGVSRGLAEIPLDEFLGSFVVLVCDAEQCEVATDSVGLAKLFRCSSVPVAATSFMVCAKAVDRRTPNIQACQEYVLLGASHSSASPIDEIESLSPESILGVRYDGIGVEALPMKRPSDVIRFDAIDDAAAHIAAILRKDIGTLGRLQRGRVSCALSAGFDSRTILAGLVANQIEPRLFVYGSEEDTDVRLAKSTALALGMEIAHVDKSKLDRSLAPMSVVDFDDSMRFFDGLPTDGAIDRGADRDTRIAQSADGRIAMNGGGGELLRNFFALPDRAYSSWDLACAFYSNWDPRVFLEGDGASLFRTSVAREIVKVVSNDRSADIRLKLDRTRVEDVYPKFRLRYWMGMNNSIAARHGAFCTPLVSPSMVELAASLPIQWKSGGRLQSKVIANLSRDTARCMTGYGFAPESGPGFRRTLAYSVRLARPVAVRRESVRIKRQLGILPLCSQPAEWLRLRGKQDFGWLGLDERYLNDHSQLSRLITLERLFG
jgi:hypothetical protein